METGALTEDGVVCDPGRGELQRGGEIGERIVDARNRTEGTRPHREQFGTVRVIVRTDELEGRVDVAHRVLGRHGRDRIASRDLEVVDRTVAGRGGAGEL